MSRVTLHLLGIAKQELMAMLEEEELKDAILLVFANKQDSRGALNSRQARTVGIDMQVDTVDVVCSYSCCIACMYALNAPHRTVS